ATHPGKGTFIDLSFTTSDIRHPTSDIRHPTSDFRRLTFRLHSLQHPTLLQRVKNRFYTLLHIKLTAIYRHLRILRWLVGRADTGKVIYLPRPRLAIQPLGVTLLAHGQRRIHIHLYKLA